MRRRILALLVCFPALAWAAPNLPLTPVTMTECYLIPDISPTGRSTPGYGGTSTIGGSTIRGNCTLQNETDRTVEVRKVVVHVLDGYGRQLFDITPTGLCPIPPHKCAVLSLMANYPGAVSIFQFSGEVTTAGPDGKDVVNFLPPRDSTLKGKKGGIGY
jgi:hypothetical protein